MAMLLLSTTADKEQLKAQRRTIVLALLISLLLHVVVLSFTLHRPGKDETLLTVSLLEPPSSSKRQIVSPSKAPESAISPNTERLSDKNTLAEKESIKRGLPSEGQPTPPSKAVPETKPQPQKQPKETQPIKQATPAKPSLKLSDQRVLSTVGSLPVPSETGKPKTMQEKINEVVRSQQTELAKPFRKSGSQGAFFGQDGVPDHLPDIPDGDITMLNAKAFKFAVFVQRVAYRVFGEFRQRSWESLPASEILRTRGSVTVMATLNPKGELIKAEMLDSSQSKAFDTVLIGAANAGAWDHNPPPGAAAEDGNIHFLFKAKTWVRRSPDGVREQRWILLGTALL
ncbi:MAG: hypothetical protein KDD66_13410 [Bdellovibrionales bacterium]|nr:hypothetical protein [Bdellovibrionales bacterium]